MEKKNIIIFGDSYSTFQGYIPEKYDCYYSEDKTCAVNRVEDTWWMRYINQTGSKLLLNDSWSGSTICYTGYYNKDCSETSSFICRLNKLRESGAFDKNDIDRVFVFGGTNDNWLGIPFGEMKFSEWKKEDLYNVFPAICYFGYLLNTYLPNTEKTVLVNTDLKPEIVDCFKTVCKQYNFSCIILHDIDKVDGHPSKLGMQQICEQILQADNSK